MGFKALAFTLLISLTAFANPVTHDPLQPGLCVADALSKYYLSNPMLSRVEFVCSYTCMNNEGQIASIAAKHSEDKNSTSDPMMQMICDNVQIILKKSDLGYVLDQKIHSVGFWAQTSSRPELRTWAKKENGGIPEATKLELKKVMNKVLVKIGIDTYPKDGNSAVLIKFATDLIEIGSETEKGNAILESYINRINRNEALTGGELLVSMMIKSHGGFLLNY